MQGIREPVILHLSPSPPGRNIIIIMANFIGKIIQGIYQHLCSLAQPRQCGLEYRLLLRRVPTIVIAHTFCASPDTRISYRQCLLIQGYFCAL